MKRVISLILSLLLIGTLLVSCTKKPEENTPTEQEQEQETKGPTQEQIDKFDKIVLDETEKDHVYITNNAVKVYQDDKLEKNGVGVLTASLARNEDEGVQFALYFDEAVENVKVTVGDIVNVTEDKLDATVYRLHYYNLSGASIEKPGYIPDVLVPLYDGSDGKPANDTCTVEAGKNQGYWITLSADETQEAGLYKGIVTVTYGDGQKIEIPLKATVYDFEIPVTPTMETSFAAGWHNDSYEDKGLSSSEVNTMAWDTLLRYRISGGNISSNPYAPYGSEQEDYVKYIAEYLEAHPVATVFQIPLYGFDRSKYTDISEGVPSGIEVNGVNLGIYELLKKYNLQNRAFYYFVDELSYGKQNVCIIQGTSQQIRQFAPGVRSVITTNYDMYYTHGSELTAVNLWCPIITDVTEEWVRSQLAEGDSVWWYTCCAPDVPYPTYRQNDNLVAPRILHWMQKDYGVQGELYWATTLTKGYLGGSYSRELNLWKSQMVDRNLFGDGILMIMGLEDDGIVNHNVFCATLRLEGIRDGMEDYEYLTLLESKYTKIIEKLGFSLTADEILDTYYDSLYAATNDYNHDAETILTMRDILAEDIVRQSDTVVRVKSDENGKRVVEVYAASGVAVTANGLTFTEAAQNGYSVYTATAENTTDDVVEIKVGNETFRRILSAYTSAE